jgi:hypothetical protein
VEHTEPLDSRDYLRHSLATLAYRGGKVLRDAPDDFGSFRVGDSSRTPAQILAHVCDLLDWALSLLNGKEAWRNSTPASWNDDVERFFRALRAMDDALASPEPLACPWPRLFQGPIADAFTHVGQLAMLRRVAGSAVRGENYYKAEIIVGRVGPDQPSPRREFE